MLPGHLIVARRGEQIGRPVLEQRCARVGSLRSKELGDLLHRGSEDGIVAESDPLLGRADIIACLGRQHGAASPDWW